MRISCGTFCAVYFYKSLMSKLLTIIGASFLWGGNVLAQPVLKSSSEKFNFGISTINSTIVHKLWLKSTGTDTVKIRDIETTCSCTTMPLSRKEIAPGDSLEVTISWDTQRTFGPVHRYPRIYYEGVEEPLRIGLSADVQYVPDSLLPVSIWPFRFELGRHPLKSVDSLEFRIKNTTDKDIEISVVSHELEQCEISLPKFLPAKSVAFGYIKVKPEFVGQEFENSITVSSSHDKKYFMTVPIRRKVYLDSSG